MNLSSVLIRPPTDEEIAERWVLVFSVPRCFVGCPVGADSSGEKVELSPAFEYVSELAFDPQRGAANRVQLVLPVEMFGARSVKVRPEAMVYLKDLGNVSSLGEKIRAAFNMTAKESARAPMIAMPGMPMPGNGRPRR